MKIIGLVIACLMLGACASTYIEPGVSLNGPHSTILIKGSAKKGRIAIVELDGVKIPRKPLESNNKYILKPGLRDMTVVVLHRDTTITGISNSLVAGLEPGKTYEADSGLVFTSKGQTISGPAGATYSIDPKIRDVKTGELVSQKQKK